MAESLRRPYVGTGPDGARRSAEIDRTEADTYGTGDPRRDACLESADRWERQALEEAAQRPGVWVEGDPPFTPLEAAVERMVPPRGGQPEPMPTRRDDPECAQRCGLLAEPGSVYCAGCGSARRED